MKEIQERQFENRQLFNSSVNRYIEIPFEIHCQRESEDTDNSHGFSLGDTCMGIEWALVRPWPDHVLNQQSNTENSY